VTARVSVLSTLLTATAFAAPAHAAAAAPRSVITGRLEIRHTDDFKRGRSTTTYEVVRRGRRIRLALGRAPRIPSGSAVVVEGRRVGSRLKGTVRPLHSRLRAAGVAAGPRKTAVILVQFDATAPPWTSDEVRQRVFTDADSTNAYYQEDSYGDVSLVGKAGNPDGDVFGWYTVPAPGPNSQVGCDVNAIMSNAEAAAGADGFVASGYDHVIYAFPRTSLCGNWAGLAQLPGTRSWINGAIDSVPVVAHELGHNMGLHHASSLRCTEGGVPVAISATCTTSEYGDPFDVMGNSSHRNNAWHLQQIGFLPGTNVQTVTQDGTYSLSSTNTRGGTPLLRVPRPNGGSPPYYDLELRSSGGVFDNFLSSDPAVQGVTIHTDPDPATITQSLLIDATPGSPSGFRDAPLAVGHTFSDGALTVTVQSIAGGVATVQVTTGGSPPDTTPPTVPAPVAEATADRVVLSWQTSTDDVGVAGYRVYRNNTLLKTTTSTTWTDFVVTPGATYSYRVSAFDAAGNVAASGSFSVTVPYPPPSPSPTDSTTTQNSGQTPIGVAPPFPPPDTTRPSVTIASPARSAHLRRRATVRAVALDAGGIALTEVWVDGVRRKVVHSGRVAWRWPLKRARRGRHLIVVRAFDTAGNEGQASARVRVVR
jgi:M6 family metalloprotease-like protein